MMVGGESLVHDKDKVFVLKIHFLKKMLYLLKKCHNQNVFYGLIQTQIIPRIYLEIKELQWFLEKQLTTNF